MPVYLLHGFRWPRPLIRIHIILQNLDDAAAEWLVAPATTATLLQNFTTLYPDQMSALPNLRFIEQYNPEDEYTKDQPYAYVADTVHPISLGVAIDDIIGGGIDNETWTALVELRDQLCPNEKVAWFIVVCGDEERYFPPADHEAAQSLQSTQPSHRSRGSNGSRVYTSSGQLRSDSGSSYENGSRDSQEIIETRERSSSFGRNLRRVLHMETRKDKELRTSTSMRTIRQSKHAGSSHTLNSTTRPSTSSRNHLPPLPPPPLPGTAR